MLPRPPAGFYFLRPREKNAADLDSSVCSKRKTRLCDAATAGTLRKRPFLILTAYRLIRLSLGSAGTGLAHLAVIVSGRPGRRRRTSRLVHHRHRPARLVQDLRTQP